MYEQELEAGTIQEQLSVQSQMAEQLKRESKTLEE